MPYFPNSLMPLTPKRNNKGQPPPNAIDADYFNTVDQEVRAIEEYLMGMKNAPPMAGRVAALVTEANRLILRPSLLNVAGGLCLSGMRMRFPETRITYLSIAPGTNDRTITVNSTSGFPDNGIISILNDVEQVFYNPDADPPDYERTSPTGISTVEWIKYSGRTSNAFLNCERSYMGMEAGTHTGYYQGNPTPTSATNDATHCPKTPLELTTRQRRFSYWTDDGYFSFFGFSGTPDEIKRQIMLESTRKNYLPTVPNFQNFRALMGATNPSVPGTYSYGAWHEVWVMGPPPPPVVGSWIRYGNRWIWYQSQPPAANVPVISYGYFRSADPTHASQGMLTGLETKDVYDNTLTLITTNPQTKKVYPEIGVPVFMGRLSVSHSFAAWTNNLEPPAQYLSPEAPRIVQLADGTLLGYLGPDESFDTAGQSVVAYQIGFMPSE